MLLNHSHYRRDTSDRAFPGFNSASSRVFLRYSVFIKKKRLSCTNFGMHLNQRDVCATLPPLLPSSSSVSTGDHRQVHWNSAEMRQQSILQHFRYFRQQHGNNSCCCHQRRPATTPKDVVRPDTGDDQARPVQVTIGSHS